MFVSLAKKHNTTNALNEVFLSRVKDTNRDDLVALLTLYLSVFQPAKVGEAGSYLSRYKVCVVLQVNPTCITCALLIFNAVLFLSIFFTGKRGKILCRLVGEIAQL